MESLFGQPVNNQISGLATILQAVLLLVVYGGYVMGMNMAVKVTNEEELKQRRKELAHRQRRIIYNNDGDDVMAECKEATPEALLKCRTSGVAGTQVDTISYCTGSSFGSFIRNTRGGQVFTYNKGKFANNPITKFIEQGTDALKIMIDFCRKNNIEIFSSIRMNDTHDGDDRWSYMISQLKKDHPEYLMGTKNKRPKYGLWTAVDYGREEIRDLAFQFIQEVCEDYDVDGIELDFLRHIVNFRCHAMGQDVGQEERDMMTGLIRRIRKMTEDVGLKRGRPILVMVRVPDSVGYSAACGLDIIQWMEENLIDILVVTSHFRLNPWEVSVQLGHKYNVPVYACLENSYLWNEGESFEVRNLLPCYRARAMNAWDSGVDGVYMFNFFDPHSSLWQEVGDPKVLETMDKVYCTIEKNHHHCGVALANGERFLNLPLLSPNYPVLLKAGKAVTIELRVAEDVLKREAGGIVPEVKLRLRVQKVTDAVDVSVKLNKKPLSSGTKSGMWLEYQVAPAFVKKGLNQFEIMVKPSSAAKPILQDLLLWVRYNR